MLRDMGQYSWIKMEGTAFSSLLFFKIVFVFSFFGWD